MRTAAAAAITFLAMACAEPPPAEQPPQDPPRVAVSYPFALTPAQQAGKAIFETMCWTCHGSSGHGDGPAVLAGAVSPPPSLVSGDLAGLAADQLTRRFRATIGQEDGGHPHMQYVASLLQPERFAEALAYVSILPYPPEIPGSAMAGRGLYETRCQGCHGPTGLGDGAAAEFLVLASPANFQTDTLVAARDWDGVFTRIKQGGGVHGSSMPPWGIMLSDAEIWDLVAYVASFQPGALSAPPGG
jgi:mono/diheme cytochrome c family protein